MIRQSTSFLVIANFLFLAALLIQILIFKSSFILVHIVLITSTNLAIYATNRKDSDEVPPIAYPCGILILMVTLFIGVSWGFAQGFAYFLREAYTILFVLATVLGGILTFIGGLVSRWEGEGRISGFPEW